MVCYFDLIVMEKRKSYSDIAAHLRGEIYSGGYKMNDRFPPERELAEKMKASRGTIRKALGQLESEGLVDTANNSGTFVKFNSKNFRQPIFESARPLELMDARFAFEPHICRLSVLNARPIDILELSRILDAMETKTNDAVAFAILDTQFHMKLVDTTGNPLLEWIAMQINSVRGNQSWTRMRKLTLEPNIIYQYNLQHRQILDAIKFREPELAAERMKEHLETARLSLTRASAT